MDPINLQKEIETMILGYLIENDYPHTAFLFRQESKVPNLNADKVERGELRRQLEKARQFSAIEREYDHQYFEGLLRENSETSLNKSLKFLIDEQIVKEMEIIMRNGEPKLSDASKAAIEVPKYYRNGQQVIIFANDFRVFSKLTLDKDRPSGAIVYTQIREISNSKKFHVYFVGNHIFLVSGGRIGIFEGNSLQCIRAFQLSGKVLQTLVELEKKPEVNYFGSFYVLNFGVGVALLDPATTAVLRVLEGRFEKVACLGPFFYFLSLFNNKLEIFSLLNDSMEPLEIPEGLRLLHFEVDVNYKYLVVLAEGAGERAIMWFPAGKTRKMGQAKFKGNFSRIKFGQDLERFLLFSESSFGIFNNKLLELEDVNKLNESITSIEFLNDRVLFEYGTNCFKSFIFATKKFVQHSRTKDGAHMIFVPEINAFAEFSSDNYSITPLSS